MDGVLAWGVELIRFVQQIGNPVITGLMKAISLLGTQWFFVVALPFIYWCVDKKRGLRLGVLVFLSAFTNLWLKDLWMQPRPYNLDPSVGMVHEPSYGLPSGHSQGSAVFWGSAAPIFAKPLGLILAVTAPLLIGFSRIYLGVHFPTDVLAGWGLGAAFVAADMLFSDRIAAFMAGLRDKQKLAIAAAMALGMNAISMKDTMISGAFFGLAAGMIYTPRIAHFSVQGSYGEKMLRYMAGMAGVAVLYVVPKLLFSSFEDGGSNESLVRFIRYAMVGAWVSLGAPWLFMRTGLAKRDSAASSGNPMAATEV
jgi:membrane-associated phospholipid phosphatase